MLFSNNELQYNTKTKGTSNIPKKIKKKCLLCYVQNGQNDIETWPAIGEAEKAQSAAGMEFAIFFFFNI